jgi:hypothetical protein
MQLDEIREQYKLIARSTNSKAQARKLEFMQHNLEQLNIVQKQVRRPARPMRAQDPQLTFSWLSKTPR